MQDLKQKILDYLARAPGASDTVHGIAEWWVLEQRIRDALTDVQRALDELLAEGFIRASVQGGLVRYAARAERITELRRRARRGRR